MSLVVYPVKAQKKENVFDLFKEITDLLKKNEFPLMNGDVLVISSKYISNSQGRIIDFNDVMASKEAHFLSKKFQIESKIVEVVIRESDMVLGGVSGFIMTSADNILVPNAGIDKSNAKKGKLILYPFNPFLISEQLRRKFFLKYSIHIGIIIVDSRLMPSRVGTIGISLACSGIEPILDLRSQKDLNGNPLKVTFQAIADNLASIANHKMGEGSESQPFAIIRNSGAKLTDRKIRSDEMTVSHDECLYMRGLKN